VGVESATPIVLHLRPGVKEVYLGWLAQVRPDLLERYDQIYGRRSYAPRTVQAEITTRFQAAFAAARRSRSSWFTRPLQPARPAPSFARGDSRREGGGGARVRGEGVPARRGREAAPHSDGG
jgi:hypothetical protein